MGQNSLKEYYISLERLYNNAVNILSALNQSLSSTSSEITVSIADTDDAVSTLRIPSFLYLESKLEQLNNNFSLLFNLPESGEAWFTKSADMYKLEMVKSNSAPNTPTINTNNIFTSFKENMFLKDLVSPKTYLKLDASNIKDNIHEVQVKKIIYYSSDLYNQVVSTDVKSYDDYAALLYSQRKGIDYDEYDSIIRMPVRHSKYNSRFTIVDIPTLESGNPYHIDVTNEGSHLVYKLRFNTIKYTDIEDSSIIYTLKQGDYLTLADNFGVYKVIDVSNYIENLDECIVTLEECAGHTALQTFEENSSMVFKIYDENFEQFKYIEIPVEENEFITIFISSIYNNVRSLYSDGINVNLSQLEITNANGEKIIHTDTNTPYTYSEYYNEYCTNIGDILAGITNTVYPQFTNFSYATLNELQESDSLKKIVSDTLDINALKVSKINEHLIDDTSTKRIVQLHSERNETVSKLSTVQSNIDKTYNQLTTTDFAQELSVSQSALKAKLDSYYSERLTLNKQLISIVSEINTLKSSISGYEASKFRIRGVISDSFYENYIKGNISKHIDIIGIDVEYKYSSVNSDTSNVLAINSNVFTEWNKMHSIDKERKLVFNNATQTYSIAYDDYSNLSNVIKWNQIDIPINQGEDVTIRLRYKYSIGQPFMNFFSPWSDEVKIPFPVEFIETNEITSIIDQNNVDIINSQFLNTLINNGYEDHINNKIIDGSQQFFHMPENIYSGFNTAENKLLSLKDKLQTMVNDIDSVKALYEKNDYKYSVYLEYDGNVIEIYNHVENKINISNIDNITSSFIRKPINIVIKNMGNVPMNLYSIFPGATNIPLADVKNEQYVNNHINKYERIPLVLGGIQGVNDSIAFQTLGQFIYFREDNPYTYDKLYYDNNAQNHSDIINKRTLQSESLPFQLDWDWLTQTTKPSQLMLAINNRNTYQIINNEIIGMMTYDSDAKTINYDQSSNDTITAEEIKSMKYDELNGNQKQSGFILKYEHLWKNIPDSTSGDTIKAYLSENTSIKDFLTDNSNLPITNLTGSFLYPELVNKTQLICNNVSEVNNQYYSIAVGDQVTIPLVFEYFLSSSTKQSSTSKTICFDIKPGIDRDVVHYIVNVTGLNTITTYAYDQYYDTSNN